jgi:hypothetical protein
MVPKTNKEAITERLVTGLLSERLLDNTIRGLWCEFMVAEALGPQCQPVGLGWHAWDLQLGPTDKKFPERIRIQVKNSAVLQVWTEASGRQSDPYFKLVYRKRPSYFEVYNKNIPCEPWGFLCDIFVLCHHPESDPEVADQLDPEKWCFYLVPVVGPNSAVTEAEITWAAQKLKKTGKAVTFGRKPKTLERGIRGRPPVLPLRFDQLSIAAVQDALAAR